MTKAMDQEYRSPELAPFGPHGSIQTTSRLDRPSNRRHALNQYNREQKIGKGRHGDVYLCRDGNNDGYELAVKTMKRSHPRDKIKLLRRNYQQNENGALPMSSTLNNIRKEIAIMKRCRHPNLVQLVEIIDDPREEKIYMIMEYLAGGPVEWSNDEHRPILMLLQTRRIMRDIILGLEYLHHEGIIHRDIKPANILYTRDRRSVKLIDFGVAHYTPPIRSKSKQPSISDTSIDASLFPKTDLSKRAGTPSFLAPEVVWFSDTGTTISPSPSYESVSPSDTTFSNGAASTMTEPQRRPPITKAIDIWSLGVTFYCFLFGHTPFTVPASANENVHHNEFILYNHICTRDWPVDDFMGADNVVTEGRHPKALESDASIITHLLDQLLQKNPKHRISLAAIKSNSWVLQDIDNPKEWMRLTSPDQNGTHLSNWVRSASLTFLKLLPGGR